MKRAVTQLLEDATSPPPDIGVPNGRLLENAVALLTTEIKSLQPGFWPKFLKWYTSHRTPWPSDGQVTQHWSSESINHFFWTVRLNPHIVACLLDIEVGDVLTEFVEAALQGLMTVRWAILCPCCNFSVVEVGSLGSVPAAGSCPLCHISAEPDLSSNLVVTFQMNPKFHNPFIHNLPCPLPTSMQQQYLGEVLVGPNVGHTYAFTTELSVGVYVLFCPLTGRSATLRVTGDVQVSEQVASYTQPDGEENLQPAEVVVCPGTITIKVTNQLPEVLSRFFLFPNVVAEDHKEHTGPRPPYVTAFQLMHHPLWSRRVYGEVNMNLTLCASECFMVFVDVSDPDDVDDPSLAIAAKEEALTIITECTTKHCGVVCEQAGDAIMGSYLSGLQALTAILEAMVRISNFDNPCPVRAGLHSGPAMVQYDGKRRSLVGKDVGRTTLVHTAAQPGQVVVSQAAFEAAELENDMKFLKVAGISFSAESREATLPGTADHQTLHIISPQVEETTSDAFRPDMYAPCSKGLLRWASADVSLLLSSTISGPGISTMNSFTDLRGAHIDASSQVNDLFAKLHAAEEGWIAEQDRANNLEDQLEKLRQESQIKIDAQQQEIDQLKCLVKDQNDKLEDQDNKLQALPPVDEGKTEAIIEAVKRLLEDMLALHNEEKLQCHVDQLRQLVEENKEDIKALEVEVASLHASISVHQEDLHFLQEADQSLSQSLAELEVQKLKLHSQVEELKGSVNTATGVGHDGDSFEMSTDVLKEAIKIKVARQQELSEEIAKATEEIHKTSEEQQMKVDDLLEEVGDLRHVLEQEESEEVALQMQLDMLEMHLSEGPLLLEALQALQEPIISLAAALKSKMDKPQVTEEVDVSELPQVKDLKEQLHQTRQELDVRVRRLAAIESELGMLHEEIRRLVMDGPEESDSKVEFEMVAQLQASLEESEAHRRLQNEAISATRTLYDQLQIEKHGYTATLQSQIRKLEELVEDLNDQRETERSWLLKHTELDFKRLCEEKAQMAKELQRIKATDPKEVGSEYLEMMEKYRKYIRDYQK